MPDGEHQKKASKLGSRHPRYGFHGVQRGCARGDGPELSLLLSIPILGCLHARSCYGSVKNYGARGIRIAVCRMQDECMDYVCRVQYMIQAE